MMALANSIPFNKSIVEISSYSHPEISLVPFHCLRDDHDLKSKYLSWLNDISNIKLIASKELLDPAKDYSFVEASFERFTSPNSIGFFIKYNPMDCFIGTCKLDSIDTNTSTATDGILIGDKDFQGKGLSSITYKLLLLYAFCYLSLESVNGGCSSLNIPMLRVFRRLGYQHINTLTDADIIDGVTQDHEYFRILKDSFLTRSSCLDLKLIHLLPN